MNASDFRDIVGVQKNSESGALLPANQDAFNQLMQTLKVVARADPSDKALICNGLKASGKKVAFIGRSPQDVDSGASAYVSYSIETSA